MLGAIDGVGCAIAAVGNSAVVSRVAARPRLRAVLFSNDFMVGNPLIKVFFRVFWLRVR